MIRIDAVWLALAPLDMRTGMETALARVITVFGSAQPHHARLFANGRANRMKVLVHDGPKGLFHATSTILSDMLLKNSKPIADEANVSRKKQLETTTPCAGSR